MKKVIISHPFTNTCTFLFFLLLWNCNPITDKTQEASLFTIITSTEQTITKDTSKHNPPLEKEKEIDPSYVDPKHCSLTLKHENNYEATKQSMTQWRSELYQTYLEIEDTEKRAQFLDSTSVLFTSRLLNKIIPYWYGTEWDFNGYTDAPNKGEIACGYFVSTTLQHMGVNINRYRLAQQAGSNICKTIALGKDYTVIYKCKYIEDVHTMLNKIPDGLYFVGLDNHVGYLYKNGKERYFLNSNYIVDKVVIEHAVHADAFMSNWYYLTKITHNREFILKWLENAEIQVVK